MRSGLSAVDGAVKTYTLSPSADVFQLRGERLTVTFRPIVFNRGTRGPARRLRRAHHLLLATSHIALPWYMAKAERLMNSELLRQFNALVKELGAT